MKDIPTDILEDEIKSELWFVVKFVKRFGNSVKSLPICLVIISKNEKSTKIFILNNIFYHSVKVEFFKKSGLVQCFKCQNLGQKSVTGSSDHRPGSAMLQL